MKTIQVSKKTGKDGILLLNIPLDKPDAEYEVVVIVQAKELPAQLKAANTGDWPAGYFDLAGSIDDDTFVRPPQGELPKPVEWE